MRNFVLGILAAAVLAAMAYGLPLPFLHGDPCRSCGRGTRCEKGLCVAEVCPEPLQPSAKKRARRVKEQLPRAKQEAQIVLKPADLKVVSSGDSLKGTEVIDLSRAGAGEHARELEQEDLDAVFRPHQAEIIACLDEARGEAQLSGTMTVSFRLQRTGVISGVRVDAPAYLLERGLLGCVRPVINGLRFPPSAKSQIVSYPFALR